MQDEVEQPQNENQDWDPMSWAESIAAGARNPNNWLAVADRCRRAFSVLETVWRAEMVEISRSIRRGYIVGMRDPEANRSVGPPAVMLCGFAIENLLKGILIARSPARVQPNALKPDRMFNWSGGGHDLSSLAKEAEVIVSAREAETLGVLADFSIWAGRYPVAQRAPNMRPTEGRPYGRGSFTSDDIEDFKSLFGRCREMLVHEAMEWQTARDSEQTVESHDRRDELLSRLSKPDRSEMEGIWMFREPNETNDDERCLVVCGGCGAEMSLCARLPAVICRCNVLHHWERKKVAGRLQTVVTSYRPLAGYELDALAAEWL